MRSGVRVAAGLRAVLADITRGRTTVLVSHDLLDIVSLADHIVVIEHGRVVERGPTAEVLARPGSAFAARLADVNIIRGRLQDARTMVAGKLVVYGISEDEGQVSGAGVATVRPGSIAVALIRRREWSGGHRATVGRAPVSSARGTPETNSAVAARASGISSPGTRRQG